MINVGALRIAMTLTAVLLAAAAIASVGLASPAASQALALTKTQSDAMNSYNEAVSRFKSVLRQRRAQIDSKQKLPDLPGQALYLARNDMLTTYKDLTDVLPSKIGRPNKFNIPPAYFDADNEPLLDEYAALFNVMQAPPANAQKSDTPFKDVVDLGTAIARAKGLDQASAEAAGRISLGLFFAETNGNQNIGNARSNTYKGSLQTGMSEDQIGQQKWAAIKGTIAALDPALIERDSEQEKRAANFDHRFNHWTAVRGWPDGRPCRSFPANTGTCEGFARSDRSNEGLRIDPDRSQPDASGSSVRELVELQNFRADDHGLFTQQQHFHVRAC